MQRDAELGALVVDEPALDALAVRELSPLGAVAAIDGLIEALRVDRPDEAQPVQPLATISVTEDMATALQLHALGWRSVYHHETLAEGLAPEDLRTMLTQRPRWAQGTLQVMLRDNPLKKKGLAVGQRLMYFATMWSYLSGFAAVVYIAAPIIYLLFGVLPVTAWTVDFFARFIPKDGRAAGGPPWRQIWPQLTAMALLAVAAVVGVIRVIAGTADGTGTLVNTVWVVYDLAVLSVIIQAARYRGFTPRTETVERHNA